MKITLITTGQPATNPRIVKEADALCSAGYKVNVIYCFWSEWAQQKDLEILRKSTWTGIQVGGDPFQKRGRWWFTRLRKKISSYLGFVSLLMYRNQARAYDEMLAAALKTDARLFIAHNLGALPVAARAAKKLGAKFAFDAEDFHREEALNLSKNTEYIIKIENKFIPKAAFVTCASPLITQTYQQIYPNVKFNCVNNVFPLTYQKPLKVLPGVPLKLFWFSQTIGLDRGLQDVLLAMQNLSSLSIQLTLVGKAPNKVVSILTSLIDHSNHQLDFVEPLSEIELFELASEHHIGLALERSSPVNHDICLANKIFTYLLAGNAIIASNTKAQSQFMQEYPDVGVLYTQESCENLATVLNSYYRNMAQLEFQRKASWLLGQKKLNWEEEQKNWLPLVEAAIST